MGDGSTGAAVVVDAVKRSHRYRVSCTDYEILRIKRYNRTPARPGAFSTLDVPDAIIDSEIVTP